MVPRQGSERAPRLAPATTVLGFLAATLATGLPAAADENGCIVTWEAPTCRFHCHPASYINVRVESWVWPDPVGIIASCGSGASCYGVTSCEVTWGPAAQENPDGICSMTWAGAYPSGDWGRCVAF